MRRGIAWIAALGLLAACSSGGGSGTRPNPVDLIGKATGCVADNGGPSGSPGIGGSSLVATCNYPTQETLTVKTFSSDSVRDQDINAGGNSAAVIAGPKWVVYVFTAYGQDTPDPAVADIAKQIGGQVR